MWLPVAALALLAALSGLVLGFAARRFRVEGDPIAGRIDALLPQSQCGQCGFAGCRPYAEEIARAGAPINLCAPGGEAVMLALADLLGREPAAPVAGPLPGRQVAVIDEAACIGCTLCLKACPVDAILGAPKQLHGVLSAACTGCALCVAPCPRTCIRLVAVPETVANWRWPHPQSRPRVLA